MTPPILSARVGVLVLLLSALLLATSRSHAQAPQVPGFVCLGESEALLRGTSLAEIKAERDKRLDWLAKGLVPENMVAHTHCVIAELMRRVGDMRAKYHYEKAIEINPKEPAYELWYTRYWQWSRGAGASIAGESWEHANKVLDKLDAGFKGITQTGSTDDVARQWAQRHLLTLTQEDGLPLLPGNAWPFKKRKSLAPQLYLAAYGSVARDTNDFWDFADTRRLTTEAQLADDRDPAEPLTKDELLEILRTPDRVDGSVRLRLRQKWLGTLDGHYRRTKMFDTQIISYGDVTRRTDVDIEEVGATYRRTFNLYPLFDLTIDAGYARQWRVGVVETLPDEQEKLNVYVASPTISHFIGPDKLSIGATYVFFDIPDRPEPAIDQSQRQRVIRAGFIDYAIYRPLRFPQVQHGTLAARRMYTRGWHWFATAMFDDERFGSTLVHRRVYSGGTTLKGIEGYDFGVYGAYTSSASELDRINQPQLENAQWRTTLRMMKRLVDEDVVPGIPGSPLTSLNMGVVVRHDRALEGPKDFESIRGTVDLWAKFLALNLRGTSFLLNASVSYQHFYHLGEGVVLGELVARMGWPTFGTLLAY